MAPTCLVISEIKKKNRFLLLPIISLQDYFNRSLINMEQYNKQHQQKKDGNNDPQACQTLTTPCVHFFYHLTSNIWGSLTSLASLLGAVLLTLSFSRHLLSGIHLQQVSISERAPAGYIHSVRLRNLPFGDPDRRSDRKESSIL